ncbi:MAG: HAD-IIIA family hydrolase [Vicinamibacterales bacterium]
MFLDRDGVLNAVVIQDGRPHPPATLADLSIYPDVADSLSRLKQAGFALVVVTNQPDVARGAQTREMVEAMNAQLSAILPLDEIRVCYHDDVDACSCRKPRAGLLTAAPHHDLNRSFMVGDRWRDVEAGRNAGCRTVFIDRGYSERQPAADARVTSLTGAVDWILTRDEE